MAARHTWLVAWADFIPVLTGLGAARATRVVHRTVFTLRSWKEEEQRLETAVLVMLQIFH